MKGIDMKLKKTDAAIVLSKDGHVEIHVPKTDPVNDNTMVITAIGILLTKKNDILQKLIDEQIE